MPPNSEWLTHVAQYRQNAGPSCTYKNALIGASKTYRSAVIRKAATAVGNVASAATDKVLTAGDSLLKKGYEYAAGNEDHCKKDAEEFFKEEYKRDPNFCNWDRSKKFGIALATGLRTGILALLVYTTGTYTAINTFINTRLYGWSQYLILKAISFAWGTCTFQTSLPGASYFSTIKTTGNILDGIGCLVIVKAIADLLQSNIAKSLKEIVKKSGIFEATKLTVRESVRMVNKTMDTIPYLRPTYLAHKVRTMKLPGTVDAKAMHDFLDKSPDTKVHNAKEALQEFNAVKLDTSYASYGRRTCKCAKQRKRTKK